MTSDPARRTAGFVSRLLAVAVDSAFITAASAGVTATTKLLATLFAKLDISTPLGVITASPTSMLAIGAYFVLSWTLAGQTVGMRVLALRVIGPDERPPSAPRALARLLAALIGALPLLAGYLLVLVDRRRLAFHDRVAGTRVIYTS
ncbi:MAG: RDD family protein [Solirubrobacteraceae bacterium]